VIEAAEATRNPYMLSFTLSACSFALSQEDPHRALDACRRGLVIAQESGNRFNESSLAVSLARLEAEHGDPLAALEHLTLAIRNYLDSGNTTSIRSPLAILAIFLDRFGHFEPAATIAGFALVPLSAAVNPEVTSSLAHLRDVLGDAAYESLVREGESMSIAGIATFANHQIDQAREELKAASA